MRIIFAVHDFFPPNHLLQPRVFLYRLGLAAASKGHSVTYLTNSSAASSIDGLAVVSVENLSRRNSSQILDSVRAIAPDVIVWSTSYLHVIGNSALLAQLPAPVFGFLACPSYAITHLIRLIPHLGIRRLQYYFLNRLAQNICVSRLLTARLFSGVISQSQSNLRTLDALPAQCRIHISPGLDHRVWFPRPDGRNRTLSAARRILFFGPPRKSRGLDILLRAFEKCAREYPNTELVILLRGGSDSQVNGIKNWLSLRSLAQHATVVGGWMPPHKLREAIWEADLVVIPFLLSESDSPLSILEAKACGRPVLSSTVAGIPDLIGRGGIALQSCTATAFSQEICRLIAEPQRLRRLMAHAISETCEYPSWDSTCDTFISSMERAIER